jgi:hypothetical protein
VHTSHGTWRRCLNAGLALLVVTAMGHCAWDGQAVVRQTVEAARFRASHEPLPLRGGTGCHNDSGCICRGATQVVAVDVTHWISAACGWLPSAVADMGLLTEVGASMSSVASTESPSRISGREMRALYASLLI